MIHRTVSRFVTLAASAAVLAMQACTTTPSLPAPVPTFHDVVTTADGVRTGYRPDQEGVSWQFHFHDDELDDAWCADLAIAPDGMMRSLAFLHRAPGGNWLLSVRTGLGPSTWSSTFSTIGVPPVYNFDNVPAVGCHPVRIAHLKDSLYGIVWVTNGELHNAVYNASASPPADLILGPVFPFVSLEGISARRVSPIWWNDAVRLIWSPASAGRIQTVTGTLSPDGITFGPGATFTTVPHDELSNAVVHDGAMYIAARQDDHVRLFRTTTGGTGWEEAAACETTWRIRGKLLFADDVGDVWVAETSSAFDNRLRNFSDCSTRAFPLPIVAGSLYYRPAT